MAKQTQDWTQTPDVVDARRAFEVARTEALAAGVEVQRLARETLVAERDEQEALEALGGDPGTLPAMVAAGNRATGLKAELAAAVDRMKRANVVHAEAEARKGTAETRAKIVAWTGWYAQHLARVDALETALAGAVDAEQAVAESDAQLGQMFGRGADGRVLLPNPGPNDVNVASASFGHHRLNATNLESWRRGRVARGVADEAAKRRHEFEKLAKETDALQREVERTSALQREAERLRAEVAPMSTRDLDPSRLIKVTMFGRKPDEPKHTA